MNVLIDMLEGIKELLQQVCQITENQRSILIQQEGDGLELLEEMARYKEDITTEIEGAEGKFQLQYNELKEAVMKSEENKVLRRHVEEVLILKEKIIDLEKQNVILLKEKLRTCAQPMNIKPVANKVVNAYKIQNAYGKGK